MSREVLSQKMGDRWGEARSLIDSRYFLCYNYEQGSIISSNDRPVPFGRTTREIVKGNVLCGTPIKEDRISAARD